MYMNIQAVEAGAGVRWITEGWRLFTLNPGMWVVLILLYAIVLVVLSLVPLVGGLAASLITPALGAGLFHGARQLDQGSDLAIDHLFVGLLDPRKRGPLLILGALYLGVVVVAVLIAMVFGGGTALMTALGGDLFAAGGMMVTVLALSLIVLAAAMAFLYAGPLVLFADQPPVEAVKMSAIACLKNMMPMLVFGLLWLVLAVVASIPLGLGWFVLGPLTVAALYISYKDLFAADTTAVRTAAG
jgi:uncharacterized membrane protein